MLILCATRGSLSIHIVDTDKTIEFGPMCDDNLDAHGVNVRIGQSNRSVECMHVLKGVP